MLHELSHLDFVGTNRAPERTAARIERELPTCVSAEGAQRRINGGAMGEAGVQRCGVLRPRSREIPRHNLTRSAVM